MSWADAFEAVILDRLRQDPVSVEAWSRYKETGSTKLLQAMAGRGQLAADADWRTATWSAFRYQRFHADAFKSALRRARYRHPRIDRVVFDLGCGAGTVGLSFLELLDEVDSDIALYYVGCDHNRHAAELATAMLDHPSLQRQRRQHYVSTDSAAALDAASSEITRDRKPFITISYLLRQDSLSQSDLDGLAGSIIDLTGRAAEAGVGAVPLVITDAAYGPSSRFSNLHEQLCRELAVKGTPVPETFPKDRRFPNLYPETEGWFVERASSLNSIERWRLELSVS
jgi:hypothetical protein